MEENFSYSKVDIYKQCPFKYKLQYVDKNFIYTDSIATEFGSLVHKTEENIGKALINNKPIPYIDLKNIFIKTLYEIQYKYVNEYKIADKSGLNYEEKAYNYLKHGIYRLEKFLIDNPELNIVGLEQKFKTNICGKTFKGSIDRVLFNKNTNTYLIQDIKTYSQPLETDALKTPLQFVIYVLAASDLYKISTDNFKCQYDLPLCDLKQDVGTGNFMSRGISQLDSLLGCIDNQQFIPKPTPLCHWCSFCLTNPNAPETAKCLCPYYSLWTPENKTHQTINSWQGEKAHSEILKKFQALVADKLYNKYE